MKARGKRSHRWFAAALTAQVVGVGYWLIAGACTPPQNGNANVTSNDPVRGGGAANINSNANEDENPDQGVIVNEARCTQLDAQGREFEIELRAVSGEGRELSYRRHVIAPPNGESGTRIETGITSDGQLVMRVIMSIDAEAAVYVSVEYGPLVPGLHTADVTIEEGVISGMINGRALVPMPADAAGGNPMRFEDGEPAPLSRADADLEAALEGLLNAAKTTAERCAPASPELKEAKIPPQDDGHDSDTVFTADCALCLGKCSAIFAGCVGGGAAACGIFGPFWWVCEGVDVIVCAVADAYCVADCNASGSDCCPVACGEVACCEEDETCLDPDIGVCCSPGETPCVENHCCAGTETCIDTGPNAGICCPREDICGNTCCSPSEDCIAEVSLCCPQGQAPCDSICCAEGQECVGPGLCCSPEREPCDTVCCAEGEECLGNGNCCRPEHVCGSSCCEGLPEGVSVACIPEQSLCCPFAADACGGKCCQAFETCCGGECCEANDVCVNDTTCCPSDRFCPDKPDECCPVGTVCDWVTDTCKACPDPDEKFCPSSQSCCPENKVCTPFAGICCDEGKIWCEGACNFVPDCIN